MPIRCRTLTSRGFTAVLMAAAAWPLWAQPRDLVERPPVTERTERISHDPRDDRPQVAAATAEAVAAMREEIMRASISRRLTVADFIHRLHAEDDLTRALQRAEMVGGPRWLDNDTCEVQLEMSGSRVGHILEEIGATAGANSPAKAEDLAVLPIAWRRRTFAGIGSSTSIARVEKVRPRAVDTGWSAVSDADRAKAIAAAKDDAIGRVIDSIKSIALTKDTTVGDALADPKVRKDVEAWLEVRPVTRVEYRRDLQLELTMAGTPGGLSDAVRRSVTRTDLPQPRTEAGWAAVRSDFERRMANLVGRASVISTTPVGGGGGVDVATNAPRVAPGAVANHIVPASASSTGTPAPRPPPRMALGRAPEWVTQRIEAEGVADVPDFKLRGAREAEAEARRKLADQINDLQLPQSVTIGKAAQQDPRLRDAVARALDKARVTKTDYYNRKGVSVTMRMDLQDVWESLKATE